MSTLSVRVSEEEKKLIQSYIQMNNLNLSTFIREIILEKIEDDLLKEEDLLKAWEQAKNEECSDHTEVWKRLGV